MAREHRTDLRIPIVLFCILLWIVAAACLVFGDTPATAGKPATITPHGNGTWEIPNRDAQTGGSATVTYESPGKRTIRYVETHVLDVQAAAPPPPPPVEAPPVVVDLQAALNQVGVVQLEPGKTYSYSSTLRVTRDGTTIEGNGARLVPKGKAQGLQLEGRKRITVRNLTLDGTFTDATGVQIRNSEDVALTGVNVVGFGGMGITVEGHSGKRCKNIRVARSLIADNHPQGPGHVSGIYTASVDGTVITESTIDRNGGAGSAATVFNHNIYIQSGCSGVEVTNNVIARASSHGLQARSGGVITGNVFLDNPIHMSVGYLNGARPHPGGVVAVVEGNVYLGTATIAGSTRGWALDVGNARDVSLRRNLITGNPAGGVEAAITVRSCEDMRGGPELAPSKWVIKGRDVFVWAYKPHKDHGYVHKRHGRPDFDRVGVKPPKEADLRSVLGPDFLSRARANPAIAVEAGPACFVAAGAQ